MNTIVVWGASSGLGAAMVEHYHQLGHPIIAIARRPEKNPYLEKHQITHIACDATQAIQVEQVVSQLPDNARIISTMGSFKADIPVDYLGHRHLIDALSNKPIERFILITSLGCGESWKYLSDRSRQAFGAVVREKSLAEAWLHSSNLPYTIVRPGGLKDGELTGTGRLTQRVEVHGLIHRTEMASVTLSLFDRPESLYQIYECIDPELTW